MDALSFTAVLSLVRFHATADSCCKHCGKRPASADDPLAPLTTAILAQPRDRTGRRRTSGRTPAERRNWCTEEATYTITMVPSNLPKTDTCPPEVKGSGPGPGREGYSQSLRLKMTYSTLAMTIMAATETSTPHSRP
jgi:hypothetical protein